MKRNQIILNNLTVVLFQMYTDFVHRTFSSLIYAVRFRTGTLLNGNGLHVFPLSVDDVSSLA